MAAPDTLKLGSVPPASAITTTTTVAASLPFSPKTIAKYKQTTRKLMDQFGQYRQQAQQQAHSNVSSMRNWLIQAINNTADTLRYYINRYPPLAAFLFTLMVLSAVPIGCFAVFTFITSAIFLSVALIGFGVVEGLCLMAGGGVLLAVLGGIALVTTIGFGWVSLVYVAYRGGSFVACKMMEGGSQIGQKTQEAISQMQQQYQQHPSSYHQSPSNPLSAATAQQQSPPTM